MSKIVLVTGAAGFIGSYLARALLLRGDSVIGIDNFSDYYSRRAKEYNLDLTRAAAREKSEHTPASEIEKVAELFAGYYNWDEHGNVGEYRFFEGDIRNQKFLEKIFAENKPTHVVHLAAMAGVDLSVQEPHLYVDVNVLGSVNLLNMSRTATVNKFVFASSSSVYGEREQTPFKENDDVDQPVSPYAATKQMQEIMNYTFHYLYNMNIINTRIFGPIYGPLQRPYRMIQQRFINQTYHNQPMTIYGDGKTGARDTTYIDDEIAGILMALDSDIEFDTVNIGSGRAVSPLEVAESVKKLMGKGEIIFEQRKKSEVPLTFADTTHAKKILGFEAQWEFEAGLSRQIEVYLNMPDWYKDLPC